MRKGNIYELAYNDKTYVVFVGKVDISMGDGPEWRPVFTIEEGDNEDYDLLEKIINYKDL